MSRLKPCVTIEREKYELIKELARAKWGIKQGNIKRWVELAIDEKIERDQAIPKVPQPIYIDPDLIPKEDLKKINKALVKAGIEPERQKSSIQAKGENV